MIGLGFADWIAISAHGVVGKCAAFPRFHCLTAGEQTAKGTSQQSEERNSGAAIASGALRPERPRSYLVVQRVRR